ncbi:MAG: fibronectin type III domain-containing protein [Planctomycetaceae bacterium]
MSPVDPLHGQRRRSWRRRSLPIGPERLEVRRALAADDGSDPWVGFVPPDDHLAVDAWVDPGDAIVVVLPPGDDSLAALTDPGDGPDDVPQTSVDGLDGIAAVSAQPRSFTGDGPAQRPTDVVATVSADGIVVTWSDPFANDGDGGPAIDGYAIEMRRLRDAAWTAAGTVTGTTTHTVVGLDASAHYVFRVTKTNIGLMQMLSAPSRPSRPSRPVTTGDEVGIAVSITAVGGARIVWDAAASGADAQVVEYRRLAATEWVRAGSFPAASGVATIDGLPGGRHYTFRILSAGGIYSTRTRAITLPAETDFLLAATPLASGAMVAWIDPWAAARTETVVEYRRLKDAVWADLGLVATAAGAVKIDGLVSNANYVFRLRQRDAQGFFSRTVATRPVTIVPNGSSPGGGGSLLVVNPFQWPDDAPLLIANSNAGDGGADDGNEVIDGSGTISSGAGSFETDSFETGNGAGLTLGGHAIGSFSNGGSAPPAA